MRFNSFNLGLRNKKKATFFIGIFGLLFFSFLIIKTIATELFFSFWYFIGFILMFILIIINRKWKSNFNMELDEFGVTVDQLPFNVEVRDSEGNINKLSKLIYCNNSKYVVTQFILEGVLLNSNKILGYRNASSVFPGSESVVMIENYPDDFRIKKIKYDYINTLNNKTSVEYDWDMQQYKVLNDDSLPGDRKLGFFSKLAIAYLGFFLIGLLLIGLGILKVEDSVNTDNNSSNPAQLDEQTNFSIPDVTVNQFQFVNSNEYDWEYYVDSINNCWGSFRIQNNSSYPLTTVKYTIVEKNTGKRCYLNFYDTILPGEKSAEDETILGNGVDDSFVPDIDILEISYTYKNNNGQYINVDYDTKLNEYKY